MVDLPSPQSIWTPNRPTGERRWDRSQSRLLTAQLPRNRCSRHLVRLIKKRQTYSFPSMKIGKLTDFIFMKLICTMIQLAVHNAFSTR
ncbi:MAG: hypothetical protein HC767_15630 [Akkermansiaceae bacterium]|nr:hypothetical protein [Akkermansiaceae bacterium]